MYRYLWRNGKLSDERKDLLEGIGFVWAQRGKQSKVNSKEINSDHSDNDSNGSYERSSTAAMRNLVACSSAAVSIERDPDYQPIASYREKLGLDRYISKTRRGSLLARDDSACLDFDDGDEALSDGGHLTHGKRSKRSKNYMTKGRTDAWMRKYEEFRNKNLRGDFSWKDNVQLRAWVRQQR